MGNNLAGHARSLYPRIAVSSCGGSRGRLKPRVIRRGTLGAGRVFERVADRALQLVQTKRLLQQFLSAGVRLRAAGIGVAGHIENPQSRPPAPRPGDRLDAAQAGHRDIDDQQIADLAAVECVESRLSARDLRNREPALSQNLRRDFAHPGVIVDEQNASAGRLGGY